MYELVVDVQDGNLTIFKCQAEQSIFMPVVAYFIAETNLHEQIPQYHEIKGGELCIGLPSS